MWGFPFKVLWLNVFYDMRERAEVLFSFKGRAGADGARGMPGEPGSKVQMLLFV